MTLDGKKMSTLLRWAVHSLKIFMCPENYDLIPSRNSIPPYFDLLPEYWPDEDEEICPRLPTGHFMTGFCPIEIDGMVTSAMQFVQPMPLLPRRRGRG